MEDIRRLMERYSVQSVAGSVWETQALEGLLPGIDACITLGGDGSMLRVARLTAPFAVPVLGINLGKLGFLAELDPQQVEDHLPGILAGNYWIEERMMIAAELHCKGDLAGHFDCLNEVVVARRHLSRVVRVEARLDGHHLTTYTGDGVLVATPTGSTAYSLAAGGPVLHPEVRNLVLTPISAFLSLRSPLVLPETTEIQLTVSTDHEAGASFDGQSDVELQSGDIVVIRVGPNPARFVRVQERAYFYHTLVHKLGIKH
jgi:NAD+ kinase